jgi:hypothetical protein
MPLIQRALFIRTSTPAQPTATGLLRRGIFHGEFANPVTGVVSYWCAAQN